MRLLALVGLVGALPCQANPDRILVLVQQQTLPATVIYEVDPLTSAPRRRVSRGRSSTCSGPRTSRRRA